MVTSPDCRDVLIIGAGPVGLAMAVALQERGIESIQVIEQTRAFRRVGQGVDLLPNGLQALRKASPQVRDTLVEAFFKSPLGASMSTGKCQWIRRNLAGEIRRTVNLNFDDWVDRFGEGRISVSWFDLQSTLRAAIDPSKIWINCRCTEITQENNQVLAQCQGSSFVPDNPYAHWDESAPSGDKPSAVPGLQVSITGETIAAKLIIAADGINSTVRQQVFQETPFMDYVSPDYSGWAAIGAPRPFPVPPAIVDSLSQGYFHDQAIVTLSTETLPEDSSLEASPRIVLVKREGNQIFFLLHFPWPLENNSSPDTLALIKSGLDALAAADFPESVLQVVRAADPEHCISRLYYQHPVQTESGSSPWSQDRIVLVGDAAHGMPPFIAQGTNQGFEDVAQLAPAIAQLINQGQLDNPDAVQAVFNQYEQVRKPRMAQVQKATLESDDWDQNQWDTFTEWLYA